MVNILRRMNELVNKINTFDDIYQITQKCNTCKKGCLSQ
jgi:hypothetical protein